MEEYFASDDVLVMATDLRNLGSPDHHHHFVKELISMALDHHDRGKEMASALLSSLYINVIYIGWPKVLKIFLSQMLILSWTSQMLYIF